MTSRPFYGEYAWAYDSLVAPPVGRHCHFFAEACALRGVAAGARVLDAGCGTGAHAFELAQRGFQVEGIDASAELIEKARRRVAAAKPSRSPTAHSETLAAHPEPSSAPRPSFRVGDIVALDAPARYDAILCRGVLNDLLDERSRREVFRSFARALRPGGVLLFDVREWEATAARKSRAPVSEKTVETVRGRLTFRSETRLEREGRRLLVSERHTLRHEGVERVSVYDFEMRCWTREELRVGLAAAGFARVEHFGAYDFAAPAGTTDRLVCVASLVSQP